MNGNGINGLHARRNLFASENSHSGYKFAQTLKRSDLKFVQISAAGPVQPERMFSKRAVCTID